MPDWDCVCKDSGQMVGNSWLIALMSPTSEFRLSGQIIDLFLASAIWFPAAANSKQIDSARDLKSLLLEAASQAVYDPGCDGSA